MLIEVEALEAELATVAGRASLADFRALLATRFEEVAFVDRRIESPVVMVSLASAALRTFDAAVLVGADAQHLPSPPSEVLFMSNAVRAELGLTTTESAVLDQTAQLAALLSTCDPGRRDMAHMSRRRAQSAVAVARKAAICRAAGAR